MKVRSIAVGLSISPEDLLDLPALADRLRAAKESLSAVQRGLQAAQHKVQTLRLVLNSFEDWLLPYLRTQTHTHTQDALSRGEDDAKLLEIVRFFDGILSELQIDFCSFGAARQRESFAFIPVLLSLSPRISCSALFDRERDGEVLVTPSYEDCLAAAQVCKEVARRCGDLGNFRFCASFSCPAQSPFFPQAYHATNAPPTLSIGLENADLLFLAFFGVQDDVQTATRNLESVLTQTLRPLQSLCLSLCAQCGVSYAGIDVSIAPGLSPIDSVGTGLEHLLAGRESERERAFGSSGTLAAVAATTAALRAVTISNSNSTANNDRILTTGYCGLMLPVMEDLTLAQRNNEDRYTLRDLLLFSSVCGVGLDTVPVPGDVSVSAIASLYRDTGAMAFRLQKPLSCRLLPMEGKKEREFTAVDSPFLCNTKVFSMP